jgi:hypothetical protein
MRGKNILLFGKRPMEKFPKDTSLYLRIEIKLILTLKICCWFQSVNFFYMAKYGLLTGSAELTRANHAIAKHALAIADAVRRLTRVQKTLCR